MKRFLMFLSMMLLVFGMLQTSNAATTFVDWQSIDPINNIATGNIGTVSVTFTGSDINFGVTDGTSTRFDEVYFNPSLASTDDVYFVGFSSIYHYNFSFSSPVENPVFHFGSLASTLTFSGISPTRISGEDDFTVVGSTVSGVLNDTPSGHDANGTVMLAGVFTSIDFTAEYTYSSTIPDGIRTQFGGTVVPIPGAIWLLGSGLVGLVGFRKKLKK